MKKLFLFILTLLTPALTHADGFFGKQGVSYPINTIEILEEFNGGNNSSSTIGDFGLGIAASPGTITSSHVAPIANHIGNRNIQISATINTVGTLSLTGTFGANFNNGGFAQLYDQTVIIRPQTNTLQELRVGFGIFGTAAANMPPSSGIYFEQDTAGANPTTWVCVTRSGGTSTATNSAITVSTNTWYKFRVLRWATANVAFFIDGVNVCNHTTNIPTAYGSNASYSSSEENLEAAVKSYDIDLLYVKILNQQR